MVKLRLAHIGLLFLTSLYWQYANAAVSNQSDVVRVVTQYIMDDVVDIPAGRLSSPVLSHSGNYQISWAFELAHESYVLEQFQLNTPQSEWSVIYSGENIDFIIANQNKGQFIYRVKGCAGINCTEYIESNTTEVTLAEDGPINVVASHSDGINVVTWDENPTTENIAVSVNTLSKNRRQSVQRTSAAAVNYQVEASVDGKAFQMLEQVTSTSYQHSVSDTLARKYQIKSCNSSNCSKASIPSNLVNGLDETTLTSVVQSSNGIQIDWAAVVGAISYRINVRVDGKNWIKISSTNSTSYFYKNSFEGEVEFKVEACDEEQCYGTSRQSALFNIPVSGQCVELPQHIKTYTVNNNFYISHQISNITTNAIPGLVNTLKGNQSITHSQYWRLFEQSGNWQLSAENSISHLEPTNGGLYMFCKAAESNAATLSFVTLDGSESFNILVEPVLGNTIQLTLLESEVVIYQDAEGSLYWELPNPTDTIQYIKLEKASDDSWQVISLSALEWLQTSPAINYLKSNYRFTFEELSGDELRDIKLAHSETEDEIILVQVEGGGFKVTLGRRIFFIHTDILGTPVAETDSNGDIL